MPNQEELRCEEQFALAVREWEQIQVPTVTVREFSTAAAMNTATDKMDGHINVFETSSTISVRRLSQKHP